MSNNNEIEDNRHGASSFPAPEDKPFSTPDNYFDQLGPRIMDRINAPSQSTPPVRPLFNVKMLLAAAAILLILIAVPAVWNVIDDKAANGQTGNDQATNEAANDQVARDQLHQDDVYYYLSLASYNEEELVDMLIEAVGNEQNIVLYNGTERIVDNKSGNDEGLSDKELIMDYLLNDGFKESELIEL